MSGGNALIHNTARRPHHGCGDEEDMVIRELAQSGIDPAFGFWAIVTAVLVGGGISIARRGQVSRR